MILLENARELLAPISILEKDEIMPRHTLAEDLGVESLGALELVLKLEERYCIEISDFQLRMLITVKDLVEFMGEFEDSHE